MTVYEGIEIIQQSFNCEYLVYISEQIFEVYTLVIEYHMLFAI